MWLNSYEMSEWAYSYCKNKKDTLETRKLITESFWAIRYCQNIVDDPEVRKYIKEGQCG